MQDIRVLLYGTGEIGRNTCDNLLKYISPDQLTVINRTLQKAGQVAEAYHCHYERHEKLTRVAGQSDVVIVATGAPNPTVTRETLEDAGHDDPVVLLDLSVPRNVSSDMNELGRIQLLTIDDLQEQNDEVLEARKESVPEALEIISSYIEEFYEWLKINSLSSVFSGFQYYLKSVKQKEMHKYKNRLPEHEMDQVEAIADRIIKKISGQCISYLKKNNSSYHTPADVISDMFRVTGK